MTDLLYKFITGKTTLFVEEGTEDSAWYYFYNDVIYKVYTDGYYTCEGKINDREILRIYNSYIKTAPLEIEKLISLIPDMSEDYSFLNLKKDGNKFFSHYLKEDNCLINGSKFDKKTMISVLLGRWMVNVKEWENRDKFLVKDSENEEIEL